MVVQVSVGGVSYAAELDGTAGDYNVRVGGVHVGRVQLESREQSRRASGRRRAPRWRGVSPWTWQGHDAGPVGNVCGGRLDTRLLAVRDVVQRAHNLGKVQPC